MPVTATRPALQVNHGLTARLARKSYLVAARNYLRGRVVATMSICQEWDSLLSAVYEQGGIILELGKRDRVVRVFEKAHTGDTP